jgi:hypothetical protein
MEAFLLVAAAAELRHGTLSLRLVGATLGFELRWMGIGAQLDAAPDGGYGLFGRAIVSYFMTY